MCGARQVRKTALTRYRQVGSDRRAISTSGESHRLSSGQYTFRFGDLLIAEAALHRLSFGPIACPSAPSAPGGDI